MLVGPEQLGFAMRSSIFAILGLVLALALVVVLLWAAGRLVGKRA